MRKIKSKNYYLLYIDLLGTQEQINNDTNDQYLNVINELYNEASLILKAVYKDEYKNIKIECKIFSDNLVLAIEKKETDNTFQNACKKDIISDFAAFFQKVAIQRGILTRGAITIGKLYFNKTFISGEALNRAYQLESTIAIYPRIMYDSQFVMNFLQSNDRRQKTNRDSDGIFYIDIFKSLSALDETFGTVENIKNALLNIWSKTINKAKNSINQYKHLQKLCWLINVYDNWCESSNKIEYKLPIPLKDYSQFLYMEGNGM